MEKIYSGVKYLNNYRGLQYIFKFKNALKFVIVYDNDIYFIISVISVSERSLIISNSWIYLDKCCLYIMMSYI